MIEHSDKLVLRANELYFNLTGEDYEHATDEILILEPPRWKAMIEKLIAIMPIKKRIILDIGSGNGFVATVLCPHLNEKDEFICLDVSSKMLDQCRLNLNGRGFNCKLIYKQYDGTRLPFENESIDVVTLNSVLHHIFDPEVFLKEAGRVLKKDGYFIIGHEANSKFYKNKIIWTLYRILYLLFNPLSITDVLRRRGFLKEGRNLISEKYDKVTDKINDILLSEGLIKERLSKFKIDKIIEYHSINGFDVDEINNYLNMAGNDFRLAYLETYNHLYEIFMNHYKNPLIFGLDKILGYLYPKDGKTMLLVFRKLK